MSGFGHKCFGCGRELQDMESHIHVGLDEWAIRNGEDTLGLDDLFTFAFCDACTQENEDGKVPERHLIDDEGRPKGQH